MVQPAHKISRKSEMVRYESVYFFVDLMWNYPFVLPLKMLRVNNRYKYLGSWITEDPRCEEELKARIGMAKAAFGKIKR